MSLETDRLAREAEERRSSLDATLDSLKGKLSPGQMVDEIMTYAREGQGADMLHNLNRQVRDNPLALGLIGAGAAWLLLGQGVRARDESHDDDLRRYPQGGLGDRTRSVVGDDGIGATALAGSQADASPGIGERAHAAVSKAGGSVGSAASGVADRVSGAASGVAGAVSGGASTLSDGATRLGHDMRDAASRAGDAAYRAGAAGSRSAARAGDRVSSYGRRARRSFLDTLQDEPLILGAVALAVGAAIGAALPSTRVEDEWMGDARDRLRDEALDHGRGMAEKVEQAAVKAYEAGSAEAENKGLKPSGEAGETLAQKVSSVAQAAAGAAKEELSSGKTGEEGQARKDATRGV